MIKRAGILFLFIFLFFLGNSVFIWAQDAEDIVDNIENERELLDYVDYENFEEIVELFYERMAEEQKTKELRGRFSLLTYKTVGDGESPYVKVTWDNTYTKNLTSHLIGRKYSGHDEHFNLYEGNFTYHFLTEKEGKLGKKEKKLLEETLRAAEELEKELSEKKEILQKIKDKTREKKISYEEVGYFLVGRFRPKFARYGVFSRFTLDGFDFSYDILPWATLKLLAGRDVKNDGQRTLIAGSEFRVSKHSSFGMDFLYSKNNDKDTDVRGISFWGEKKDKSIDAYGEYTQIFDVAEELYLKFSTKITKQLSLFSSLWNVSEKTGDPAVYDPLSFTPKLGGQFQIRYKLYKDAYFSLKFRMNDNNPDEIGGKSRSGYADFYFKPTPKSRFKFTYQRYISTTDKTNVTTYGELKYTFSPVTYVKLKLKFYDSDINTDGGKTTETKFTWSRKLNLKNKFYVELRETNKTAEDPEYRIKLSYDYLY